jgi:hypothetical protein
MASRQKFVGFGIFLAVSIAAMSLSWLAFAHWEEPVVRWMMGSGDELGLFGAQVRDGGDAIRGGFFLAWAISVLFSLVWLGYAANARIWKPGDVMPKRLAYWVLCFAGLIPVAVVPAYFLGWQVNPIPPHIRLLIGLAAVILHLVVNWLLAVPLCTCRTLRPVVPLGQAFGRR